jgi:6-phospho-beta-glucosidase
VGGVPGQASFRYGGLNHLGWVTSFSIEGEEREDDLLRRYEELQRFDHTFAGLDADLVRRVGALPTEYLFYYYDARRYVDNMLAAGTSRGQDVARLNQALLDEIGQAFSNGDADAAWSVYSDGIGQRSASYMAADTARPPEPAGSAEASAPGLDQAPRLGGYEAVALSVVDAFITNSSSGQQGPEVIVNTLNGTSLSFLAPDDVVEVPAQVTAEGIVPLPCPDLPRSAIGLISQVKEYERAIVEAAVTGDARLAAVGLALHPLVPGITAARQLVEDYRREHGPYLAYLR